MIKLFDFGKILNTCWFIRNFETRVVVSKQVCYKLDRLVLSLYTLNNKHH